MPEYRVQLAAAPWSVVAGESIPDSLVRETIRAAGDERQISSTHASPVVKPVEKGLSLGKQTFWMAITQMGDVVTQSMGPGGTPFPSERIMMASATAVLSITMRKHPRLRKWLVRLGALGLGWIQGASVFSVFEKTVGDPQLLGSMAPNLAAQAVSLLAIFKLFMAAGRRR